MTTQFDPNDPFQSACNPEPRCYWGQFDTDARFVTLKKGVGKVAYDPQVDDPQQKRTAITLTFAPLPEHNMSKPMVREHLDSDAAEWVKVTLASMKANAIADLRQLNGAWCKVQIVETRAVPTSTGGTFQKTAFKIIARFVDEAACRADWQAKNGNGTQYGGATVAPVNGGVNGAAAPSAERVVALAFLNTLLPKQLAGATNLAQGIARAQLLFQTQALIGRHFNTESPEVVAFLHAQFGAADAAPEGEAQPAEAVAQVVAEGAPAPVVETADIPF